MEDIEDQTRRFAADLTSTVRAVCHDAPEFQVDIADRKGRFNAMVRTENGCAIPLTIGGVHLLDLLVTYQCIMSDHYACMAIEQSRFHLRPHGGGEMLVRLEYIRRPPFWNPVLPPSDSCSPRRLDFSHVQERGGQWAACSQPSEHG